jgi:5'-deoxynucleotidase YfbR-like HD superfamily hydrolase
MLHPQSTGEHAWRVACLYVELFGLPRAEVLYYCLHHDSGELWAGDMPFGSKDDGIREQERHGLEMLSITLPELSEEESIRFKICDLLEMHETGMHELRLGNQYADPIMKDTLQLAIDLSLKYDNHDLNKAIYDYMRKF